MSSRSKSPSTAVTPTARMLAAVSQSKAASILAVGVTAVEGDFERDDIVRILSPEGAPLGVGRISCDSATARRNLGRKGLKPLIHCDYLYLE